MEMDRLWTARGIKLSTSEEERPKLFPGKLQEIEAAVPGSQCVLTCCCAYLLWERAWWRPELCVTSIEAEDWGTETLLSCMWGTYLLLLPV